MAKAGLCEAQEKSALQGRGCGSAWVAGMAAAKESLMDGINCPRCCSGNVVRMRYMVSGFSGQMCAEGFTHWCRQCMRRSGNTRDCYFVARGMHAQVELIKDQLGTELMQLAHSDPTAHAITRLFIGGSFATCAEYLKALALALAKEKADGIAAHLQTLQDAYPKPIRKGAL